uniref:Uncharacterized protein n=1 Tax=Arundo donax TaxID=35708 RepID=A0A0A9F330_ARUDO
MGISIHLQRHRATPSLLNSWPPPGQARTVERRAQIIARRRRSWLQVGIGRSELKDSFPQLSERVCVVCIEGDVGSGGQEAARN